MTEQDIERQIRRGVQDFVDLCRSIEDIDEKSFDTALKERLVYMESIVDMVPDKRSEIMRMCFDAVSCEVDESFFFHHTRHKPYGYAGDFKIIDAIYQNTALGKGKEALLDKAYLRLPAAQAVRNRKDYFVDKCIEFFRAGSGSILSLACGPCREIHEAVANADGMAPDTFIHLVDQEKEAITYAQGIMNHGMMNGHVFKWETGNVLRIQPDRKYGLIWCAGLFDYLDNRVAVFLLKRIWRWLDKGGEAIIGNFHPVNPSRLVMEWIGDWHLIHRTETNMKLMADYARIPLSSISFGYEPLGINMFMHIRKE